MKYVECHLLCFATTGLLHTSVLSTHTLHSCLSPTAAGQGSCLAPAARQQLHGQVFLAAVHDPNTLVSSVYEQQSLRSTDNQARPIGLQATPWRAYKSPLLLYQLSTPNHTTRTHLTQQENQMVHLFFCASRPVAASNAAAKTFLLGKPLSLRSVMDPFDAYPVADHTHNTIDKVPTTRGGESEKNLGPSVWRVWRRHGHCRLGAQA